jgi:hypothetical protein
MGGIFISYRREDSGPYAGRLRDRLTNHFGASQVFLDIHRIKPGQRFPRVIEEAVGSCDALLAVIGPKWLSIKDENGQRRLDDPNDYLRREVVAALRRPDVLVIPVLVGTVRMPKPKDLPEELAPLTESNAIRVSDESWDDQVLHLIEALETVVKRAPVAAPARERPSAPSPEPLPPPRQEQQPAPWPSSQPSFQPASAAGPYSQPASAGWPTQASHQAPTQPAPARSKFPTGVVVALVIVGALAVLGFVGFKVLSGFWDTFGPGDPTVVLSPTSGPSGTVVTVTGTGFAKDENVDIIFHATEVGTTRTGEDGSFTTQITIPDTPFKDSTDIKAVGKRSVRFDSAPFIVT